METLILTLCMHSVRCLTIKFFHAWLGRSDQSSLIKNVEQRCLGITRVRSIQDRVSTYTNTAVTAALGEKKKQQASLEDQPPKLNQIEIVKDFLLEIRTTNRDIIWENILLLLNYSLLHVNFNDLCRKNYNGQVKKCIVYLVMIYQGFYQIRYSMELIYIVAYMKRI